MVWARNKCHTHLNLNYKEKVDLFYLIAYIYIFFCLNQYVNIQTNALQSNLVVHSPLRFILFVTDISNNNEKYSFWDIEWHCLKIKNIITLGNLYASHNFLTQYCANRGKKQEECNLIQANCTPNKVKNIYPVFITDPRIL